MDSNSCLNKIQTLEGERTSRWSLHLSHSLSQPFCEHWADLLLSGLFLPQGPLPLSGKLFSCIFDCLAFLCEFGSTGVGT
jgi:hypothetical protein